MAKHLGIKTIPEDIRNQTLQHFKHFSYQGKLKNESYFPHNDIFYNVVSFLLQEKQMFTIVLKSTKTNSKSAYFDQQTTTMTP